MPVPTTNVGLSSIQTEYGGSNPISLSEYYRGAGGGYVPSGQTSAYGTIPTFGAISVGVFRGTTKVASNIVNITDHSMYVQRQAFNNGASSALARLRLSPDGVLSLLGSTAWSPAVDALGEITINGNDYFSDTSGGSTSGNIAISGQWLQSGTPSLFSARVTIVSGGTPNGSTRIRSGTFGSWLPITSTLDWLWEAYSNTGSRDNIMNNVVTLDIALTSDTSTIIDSATITVTTRAQTASGPMP